MGLNLSSRFADALTLRRMDEAKRAIRLRRFQRWEERKCLWLMQCIFMLEQVCGERGVLHDWLQSRIGQITGRVIAFIFCRAALNLKMKPACGFADPRQCRTLSSVRAVLGSSLRRAFKARTVLGRLSLIRRALENRETLIARFARRLRKGLTRISQAHTRALIRETAGGAFAFDGLILALGLLRAPDGLPDTS